MKIKSGPILFSENKILKIIKLSAFLMLIALYSCSFNRSNPLVQYLDEGWNLTTDTLNINLKVEVPSIVQTDLYDAGLIPNPYLGVVEEDLLWIPQREWEYNIDFDVHDAILRENVVELVFEGLDTYADVWLNGEKLFHADNMFRDWKSDVKNVLKEKDNHLRVKFYPFDKERDSLIETYRLRFPEKYAVMRKAGYQNGWDWAPRYLNIGIWQPVYLKAWSHSMTASASITTIGINDDNADMSLNIRVKSEDNSNLEVQLFNGEEKLLDEVMSLKKGNNYMVFPFSIKNPKLWWPNEMGDQNMYDFTVKIIDCEEIMETYKIRTGIRDIEMVYEPDSIGKAFYFKVNDIPLYIKGSNYIPEDMLASWMSRSKTKKLLEQCKDAHFNMLRVWGGGIYPPDYFFEICDSLGILVWQDFMFAGSMYPYSDEFLENVRQEAIKQVVRYKNHPSLALWCGNNEISEGYYNWGWQKSMNWTEEDDHEMKAGYDTLFEKILQDVVNEYDGVRPYWPSSPSKGWGRAESLTEGDVHYWGVWWGEQPFEMYLEKVGRFNSEFGYQAYPSMATLRKINGGKNPEIGSEILKAHQKHGRGELLITNHIDKYFGKFNDIEDIVYLSQLSQAFGIGMAIEAQRGAKPRSMGTLYWQVNDAWPVISWSSIDYYGHKKALQYKLKDLYAPIYIGIKPSQEKDYYTIWVNSDLQRPVNGRVSMIIKDMHGLVLYSFSENISLKANDCISLPDIYVLIPGVKQTEGFAQLIFTENGEVLSERTHYFVYPKNLDMQPVTLKPVVNIGNDKITIEFDSPVLVKDVYIESSDTEGEFSDNFFDVLPCEKKIIEFYPSVKSKKYKDIEFKYRNYIP